MKRLRAGEPDVATTELMAFTTGAFYLAGGTAAALSTVPTWHAADPATTALLALAGVAVAAGAALLVWGRRLPRWAFHGVVGCASLMLAAGVVLSEDLTAAVVVGAVFVFCAVDILYFFHGKQALVQCLLLMAAVAVSTSVRGVHPAHTAALLLVQGAVIIVIGRLVARAAHGARDALTGLPNRRAFDERLEMAVPTSARSGTPLSVALIDVDHFKAVNDSAGHAAGDALLGHLAITWSAHLPAGVHLARQGGDEFALLALGHNAADLAAWCQRLHHLSAPNTISIGIATLDEAEGGADVVRRADSALYEAKSAGRACTRIAPSATRSPLPRPRLTPPALIISQP